jgi:hypothetical protein
MPFTNASTPPVDVRKTLRRILYCVAIGLACPDAILARQGAVPPTPPSSAATGSVCLPSIAEPTDEDKSLFHSTGRNPPPEYSVQIGSGPTVQFLHSPKGAGPGILITGIPIDQRHLIRIRHQGKPLESFRFRFDKEDRGKRCLFLETFYLTWQLWAVDRIPPCRCAGATAIPWGTP